MNTPIRQLLSLLAATLLAGCSSVSELSQKPARATQPWEPKTVSDSTITASVQVPYSYLAAQLNQKVPAQYNFSGRSHGSLDATDMVEKTFQEPMTIMVDVVDHVRLPWPYDGVEDQVVKKAKTIMHDVLKMVPVHVQVPYDVDYHGAINRTPITVAKGGTGVRLGLPFSVAGQVGLAGDGARLILLQSKNVAGALNAWAYLTLDLTDDWSPAVAINPGYEWTTEPRIEAMHGVWISLKDQVNDGLNDSMESLRKTAPAGIPADAVKAPAQAAWHRTLTPVAIPGSPNGTLEFIPTKAGFSGVQYTANALSFSLSLSGRTTFYSKAPSAKDDPISLPKLQRIPAGANGFAIVAPLYVNYATLQEQLHGAFLGKVETAETPAGKVDITFSKFEVFQTADDRLALGLYFAAKFESSRALSTEGVVWVTGKPTLDPTDQVIALKDVSFARILDNKLWSLLTTVFSGPIKTKLDAAAKVDMKPTLSKATADMKRQLNGNPKLPLHVEIADAKLQELGLTNDSLVAVARLTGSASVDLGLLK